jgi:hypothetical protein
LVGQALADVPGHGGFGGVQGCVAVGDERRLGLAEVGPGIGLLALDGVAA